MAVVNFYRGYFNDLVGRLRGSFIESRLEDRNREAEIISSGTFVLLYFLNACVSNLNSALTSYVLKIYIFIYLECLRFSFFFLIFLTCTYLILIYLYSL